MKKFCSNDGSLGALQGNAPACKRVHYRVMHPLASGVLL